MAEFIARIREELANNSAIQDEALAVLQPSPAPSNIFDVCTALARACTVLERFEDASGRYEAAGALLDSSAQARQLKKISVAFRVCQIAFPLTAHFPETFRKRCEAFYQRLHTDIQPLLPPLPSEMPSSTAFSTAVPYTGGDAEEERQEEEMSQKAMDVFSAFDPGVDLRPAANASGELKGRFQRRERCRDAFFSVYRQFLKTFQSLGPQTQFWEGLHEGVGSVMACAEGDTMSWFAGLFVRTLTRQCIAPTLEADPSLRKMLARAGRWRALSGRLTGQGRGGVQVSSNPWDWAGAHAFFLRFLAAANDAQLSSAVSSALLRATTELLEIDATTMKRAAVTQTWATADAEQPTSPTFDVHNLYTKFCEAAALGQLLVGAQIAGRGVQTAEEEGGTPDQPKQWLELPVCVATMLRSCATPAQRLLGLVWSISVLRCANTNPSLRSSPSFFRGLSALAELRFQAAQHIDKTDKENGDRAAMLKELIPCKHCAGGCAAPLVIACTTEVLEACTEPLDEVFSLAPRMPPPFLSMDGAWALGVNGLRILCPRLVEQWERIPLASSKQTSRMPPLSGQQGTSWASMAAPQSTSTSLRQVPSSAASSPTRGRSTAGGGGKGGGGGGGGGRRATMESLGTGDSKIFSSRFPVEPFEPKPTSLEGGSAWGNPAGVTTIGFGSPPSEAGTPVPLTLIKPKRRTRVTKDAANERKGSTVEDSRERTPSDPAGPIPSSPTLLPSASIRLVEATPQLTENDVVNMLKLTTTARVRRLLVRGYSMRIGLQSPGDAEGEGSGMWEAMGLEGRIQHLCDSIVQAVATTSLRHSVVTVIRKALRQALSSASKGVAAQVIGSESEGSRVARVSTNKIMDADALSARVLNDDQVKTRAVEAASEAAEAMLHSILKIVGSLLSPFERRGTNGRLVEDSIEEALAGALSEEVFTTLKVWAEAEVSREVHRQAADLLAQHGTAVFVVSETNKEEEGEEEEEREANDQNSTVTPKPKLCAVHSTPEQHCIACQASALRVTFR